MSYMSSQKFASMKIIILLVEDRAHLSTFKIFIFEKFSCFIVLVVFLVIVQSPEMISVWFCEKMTFFPNFFSYHIFAIYVGGASFELPTACRLIAVSGARLPSVDGLVVRCIKMHHHVKSARPSGITWPRSSTDGLRTCWAGMSSPWGALYRRWSTLSPAAGTRPRPRQRQRPRHRWRLHGKRTKRRPQRPLPLKTGARPQRPLHPKRTSLKKAGRRRRHDGTSGVGSHRTLARLNPSLASAPGQPPRRRGHRRRPRRRSPVPASATTARALATRHAAVPTRRSAPSAAARTLVSTAFPNVRTASRLHTTATSAWKKVTAADRGSVRTAHDLHRRPSPPHPRTLKTPWTSLPPPATPPPRKTSLSSPTSRHSSRIPETTTTSDNGSGSRTQTPWPSTYSPPTLSAKYRSSSPSSTPRSSSCKPWRTWAPSTSVLQTNAEAANTSTGSPPGISTPSTPACWRPTTTSAPPGRSIPSRRSGPPVHPVAGEEPSDDQQEQHPLPKIDG